MKQVSILNAVRKFSESYGDEAIKNMDLMHYWAKECEKKLVSPKATPIIAVKKTITDGYIDEPLDSVFIYQIVDGDKTLETDNLYFKNMTEFIHSVGTFDKVIPGMLWTISSGRIVFPSLYEGRVVTVIYGAIKVLNDVPLGSKVWLVNENHIEAISAYIEYMYVKSFNRKKYFDRSTGMFRNNEFHMEQTAEVEYRKQLRNARAIDYSITPYDDNNI